MPVHRRAFALLVAVAATVALAASAQQPQQAITAKALAPNVYWVQGGAGANSGFVVGKSGVVVIDAGGTPEAGKQLLAAIAKTTSKPVTQVILTHTDADHAGGLTAFPAGVTIIAHENAKSELESAAAAAGPAPAPPVRLPTQVVHRVGEAVTIEGVTFDLHHWAPAHTSGDLIVYLPAQKIVFTGDIITTNRPDPLIHLEKKGSSEGWITTVKGMLGLAADQFVPGHGELQTKAQVQARLSAVVEKRDRIVALVKDGKSLDDVKAAFGEPPAPAAAPGGLRAGAAGRPQGPGAAPPGRGPGLASFAEVVYQELTRRQ